MRWLPLALVALGCGADRPGQIDAHRLVWSEVYAADPMGSAPPIEWREDECGGALAGVRYDGQCYAGLYLPNDRALVAWRGTFHESAFAHELMHALQYLHGVEDPAHLRPEWSAVAKANEKLLAAGL